MRFREDHPCNNHAPAVAADVLATGVPEWELLLGLAVVDLLGALCLLAS